MTIYAARARHSANAAERQLSHDCDQSDLGGFSSFDELEVLCFEVRIKPGRDKGGHVEGPANAGAPASNEGAPGPTSGLACDWREPDEISRRHADEPIEK